MSTKKVSYMKLLKEAISEFDTSKSVDIKGPMLDPILSYSGSGELPTNVDAASILERYYFQEENDSGVNVNEDKLPADDNKVDAIPGKEPQSTKKDIEKELTEDDAVTELENSVIEKLIAEMEDEDEEGAEVNSEANRETGDEGEGTQAAGTGNADDQVPDRKDKTNEWQNDWLNVNEQDEEDIEDEEPAETKDIDKEVKEQAPAPSAVPGGPGPDKEDDDKNVEEAFAIFKEQIEDEENDEEEPKQMSSDEVQA